MKNIFALLAFAIVALTSCNSSTDTKKNEEKASKEISAAPVTTVKGEYIYLADAAVLKGDTFIFGVELNEVAKELGERVAPVKNNDYDMVPVIVKGTIKDKPEGAEGWDKIVTITEIVEVGTAPAKTDIKIEDNNNAKD